MSDLYRITDRCDTPVCSKPHVHDRNGYRRHWQKVEPCKHGRIDRHKGYIKDDDGEQEYLPNGAAVWEWCKGAKLS